MGIKGNLSTNGDLVSRYIGSDDFITMLYHVGQPLHSGRTDYPTGLTSEAYGTLAKQIPCQHGRLTIGYFD